MDGKDKFKLLVQVNFKNNFATEEKWEGIEASSNKFVCFCSIFGGRMHPFDLTIKDEVELGRSLGFWAIDPHSNVLNMFSLSAWLTRSNKK